jgi:hypothetical protein
MSGWDIGAALRRQCEQPWNRGLPAPEPPASSEEELILWRGVFQDFIDWNTQVGELLGLILSDATPADLEELRLAAEACSRGSLLARTCREMTPWMQTCCDFREAHLSGGAPPCFDLGAVLRWEAHKALAPDGEGNLRSARDSPAEMALLTYLHAHKRDVPAWGWILRTLFRAPAGEAAYHPRTRRQGAVADLILDAVTTPARPTLVEVFRGEAGERHVANLHPRGSPLSVTGAWPLGPLTERLLVSQGWPESLANLTASCEPPFYQTPLEDLTT